MSNTMSTSKLPDFTAEEARKVIDNVKKSFEFCYTHIAELHARRADKALDYPNWAEFVKAEFNFSERYGYHLIHASKLVAEIEIHTGVRVALSEKMMRKIKMGDVEQIQAITKKAIADGKTPETAVLAAVTEVARVAEETAAAQQQAGAKPRKARPGESVKKQDQDEPGNQASRASDAAPDAQPDAEPTAAPAPEPTAAPAPEPTAAPAPEPTPEPVTFSKPSATVRIEAAPSYTSTWTEEGWKNYTLNCTTRDGLAFMREHQEALLRAVEQRINEAEFAAEHDQRQSA